MISYRNQAILAVFCSLIPGVASLWAEEVPIYDQSAMYACQNSWILRLTLIICIGRGNNLSCLLQQSLLRQGREAPG